MIPIRDTAPSRYPAIAMYVLIGINVVVFVLEASLGEAGIERLFNQYAFIPAHMSATPWSPMVWLTLFTSMFLHGGLGHLAGNMWTLWGLSVSDQMPTEILELMDLYPQPVRTQPSVTYLPSRKRASEEVESG